MGLDCSHDALHGAYSAFNRLRQAVAEAMGGSYPPHWMYTEDGHLVEDSNGRVVYRTDLDEERWYWGEDYSEFTHPGLAEFMGHSDCDGEILPAMCTRVADDLETLLPRIEALGWPEHGHIKARGGFSEVTKAFISGCRKAAANNEPLKFG